MFEEYLKEKGFEPHHISILKDFLIEIKEALSINARNYELDEIINSIVEYFAITYGLKKEDLYRLINEAIQDGVV
ncbi:hypothetical protein QIT30_gp12 [Saccharolobus solfataricus rod-shaped virus 1]|uniref:Uncharacterized protein n=1 Tax=Saccharolobus solfataricus rod-shaped virus 1 TaxID=2730619 RepID=A0A6M3VWG6_SSRV1|nr:hypothetical protein QIT30_gp12 [Saccharolobus solfataricus rod-shaped virus 1]QJF12288.1 hypothetical protein SSRV1_gp12 [Saccharolobus solfataricus rod-shaped virus 1]